MRSRTPYRSSRSGMTVIEVLIVMTILAVALHMTTTALVNTGQMEPLQREYSVALAAVRSRVEEIRSRDASQVFALYNADPADDPLVPGTAPGSGFAVADLELLAGDADGLVGRVEFPTALGELREDFVDREMGMPRDLNLDGVQDAADHAADYVILPYRVHVEWLGEEGRTRRLSMCGTVLVE